MVCFPIAPGLFSTCVFVFLVCHFIFSEVTRCSRSNQVLLPYLRSIHSGS